MSNYQDTIFSSEPTMISNNFASNGGGSLGDLWLPVFGGEILAAFEQYNTFTGKVRSAVISEGNTAHFPSLGRLESEIHARGAEMIGMPSEQTDRVITLEDRPVVSHFETDDIERLLTYYAGTQRAELATQAGRALARQWDAKIAMLIAQASREGAAANVAAQEDFPGGGLTGTGDAIVAAATATADEAGALAILDACQQAAVRFDEEYLPMDGRFCAVTPAMWYALKNMGVPSTSVGDSKAYFGDSRYASTAGQIDPSMNTGAASAGTDYLMHNGIQIFRSVSLPSSDETANSNIDAKYRADYRNTTGLIFQQQAVGAVVKQGVSTESFRDVRRQSDFFVAKVFTGGGTLRPQCAITVASAGS